MSPVRVCGCCAKADEKQKIPSNVRNVVGLRLIMELNCREGCREEPKRCAVAGLKKEEGGIKPAIVTILAIMRLCRCPVRIVDSYAGSADILSASGMGTKSTSE